MFFNVTYAALSINVVAMDEDGARSAAKEMLGLSHSEAFYAEVTNGFVGGVKIVNAVS